MPFITIRSVNPGTTNRDGVPTSVGLAWVEITDSAYSPTSGGAPESYGYYPEVRSPVAAGEVRPTDAWDYSGKGKSSRPFYITEDQAQAVHSYAENANSGMYEIFSMPLADNCATFTVGAMKEAGISPNAVKLSQ